MNSRSSPAVAAPWWGAHHLPARSPSRRARPAPSELPRFGVRGGAGSTLLALALLAGSELLWLVFLIAAA